MRKLQKAAEITPAAALIDALPANLVSHGKQVEREALAGFILNELARSSWMLIHRDEARASLETGLDARCGDHPKLGHRPLGLGCGESIESASALYRCAQCDTAFHRECIRQHFGWPEAGGGPAPHALDAALAALTPEDPR